MRHWFKNNLQKIEYTEHLLDAEEIDCKKEFPRLRFLSQDKDVLVRKDVAEILGKHFIPEVEELLRGMTFDKSGLVRTCAAEALWEGQDEETQLRLWELLQHDSSSLVRGYALEAYLNVWASRNGETRECYEEYLRNVEHCKKKEQNQWVLVNYYLNEYEAGRPEALDAIADLICNCEEMQQEGTSRSQVQSNGFHALLYLKDDQNESRIDGLCRDILQKNVLVEQELLAREYEKDKSHF